MRPEKVRKLNHPQPTIKNRVVPFPHSLIPPKAPDIGWTRAMFGRVGLSGPPHIAGAEEVEGARLGRGEPHGHPAHAHFLQDGGNHFQQQPWSRILKAETTGHLRDPVEAFCVRFHVLTCRKPRRAGGPFSKCAEIPSPCCPCWLLASLAHPATI